MSDAVLSADRVVAGYVRGLPIVHGVSVDVAPGEIVTIIGPNGAGKSTLLKAVAGLIVFEGGAVTVAGRDVSGLPAHEMVRLRRRLRAADRQHLHHPQRSGESHRRRAHLARRRA